MVKISTDGYILPQSLVWYEVGKCHDDEFPVEGTGILFKKKNFNDIDFGTAQLLEEKRNDGYPYTAIFVSDNKSVTFFEKGDCFAVLPESCEKAEQEEQP